MAPFQMRYGLRMSPSRSYDEEEEDDEEDEEEFDDEEMGSEGMFSPPLIMQSERGGGGLVGAVVGVLRRSLVMCKAGAVAEEEDDSEGEEDGMEIGQPTDVRHVSHVTFDRYGGFLGLPADLGPDVLLPTPSARFNFACSTTVFGVAPTSLQSSYDQRGNSVPTVLLIMQKKLYQREGLKIEGIFRINPENSQEICVREQLNRGVVPDEVDSHCLAGLIKAWFRELPTGVLDSLTPEQVMHCNTEEECALLACMLPPVEAALLDWAINLMADVVEYENYNKMNARNIAMVFAPNMTQMSDPLTALMHAVQVMNFLKTLILKTLKERQAVGTAKISEPCSGSPSNQHKPTMPENFEKPTICSNKKDTDHQVIDMATSDRLLFGPKQDHDAKNSFRGAEKHDIDYQKWHKEVLHHDANKSFEGAEKRDIDRQKWHREVLDHDANNSLEGSEKSDTDRQKWHREILDHDANNSFEGAEKLDVDRQKWHREILDHDANNCFEGAEQHGIDRQKWRREVLDHDANNSFEGSDKFDIDHQKWHREVLHYDAMNSFEGAEKRDIGHQKWLLDHNEKNSFEGPEKCDMYYQMWHREVLHHGTKIRIEEPEKPDIDHQKWHREVLHHDAKISFEETEKPDIDHQMWHREVLYHNAKISFEGPQKRDIDYQKWHREIFSLGNDPNSSSGKQFGNRNVEGLFDKFNFRKGVEKLCRHPVFQLSRPMKKSADVVVFDAPGDARQAWV